MTRAARIEIIKSLNAWYPSAKAKMRAYAAAENDAMRGDLRVGYATCPSPRELMAMLTRREFTSADAARDWRVSDQTAQSRCQTLLRKGLIVVALAKVPRIYGVAPNA